MKCPHCGADERLGVWLTPAQLRVFDKIKRAGTTGTTASEMEMTTDLAKAHVWFINTKLEETDWKIVGRPYRLVKR